MDSDYNDLNSSLLMFLPKKASGTISPSGEGYYEAPNVRPLNETNSDNRLLANAVRYAIEPLVGERVSACQRGFIGGRPMLANLVDLGALCPGDARTSLHTTDSIAANSDVCRNATTPQATPWVVVGAKPGGDVRG